MTVIASGPTVGVSGFCRAAGVASEYAYKRRCVETGKIMYHAHIGLSSWDATAAALTEVVGALGEDGRVLDRFGLCLDRAMSLPEARRHTVARETGPVLTADEWAAVLEDPSKLERFTSFVNAPGAPDPSVEFVDHRGHRVPAGMKDGQPTSVAELGFGPRIPVRSELEVGV